MNTKNNKPLLFFCLSLISGIMLGFAPKANANGYELKVRVKGLQDTICYLGNHFGDKQYITDTVRVDHEGWAVFRGKDSLPGGIYLIIMPNKTYFEIIVNEQKFTIETDTID